MIPRLSYFYFKINNPRHLTVTGQALRPVLKKWLSDLCMIYVKSTFAHQKSIGTIKISKTVTSGLF